MNNKEVRYVGFIAVSIVMAIVVCVTNIANSNLFGVVTSILLLALLCVGLGYLYCKYEDKLFVGKVKAEISNDVAEKKTKVGGLGDLFKSESKVDLSKVLEETEKQESGEK
jgi:membrane protein required for beta-lactamase induction